MALNITEALKLGGIVDNPAQVKKWTMLSNLFAAAIAIIIGILNVFEIKIPYLTESGIIVVSSGLAALWLIVNNFVAIITSRKLGSKPK